MDLMQISAEWASSDEEEDFVHLLSYPFLFSPSTLTSYFRAINYDAMRKAFEASLAAERLACKMIFTDPRNNRGAVRISDQPFRRAQTSRLVLEIRREHVLTDAMDQLWRRQHRELKRPLKVRLGEEKGEEGVDLGGVQQEFFRIAIVEAFDPKYGK